MADKTRDIYVHHDFHSVGEVRNALFHKVADLGDVEGPSEAQFAYQTSDKHAYIFEGANWRRLGSNFVRAGGDIYWNEAGNVGFGTNTPQAKVHINGVGTFRYSDGNQQAGRILQSDATGVASWVDIDTYLSGIQYPTLNEIGSNSVSLGDSYYQMKAGIDVEFRASTGEVRLLYLDEDILTTSVGTSINPASFHVYGTFLYADGSEGVDKILKSNASGQATWVDFSSLQNVVTSSGIEGDGTAGAPVKWQGGLEEDTLIYSGDGAFPARRDIRFRNGPLADGYMEERWSGTGQDWSRYTQDPSGNYISESSTLVYRDIELSNNVNWNGIYIRDHETLFDGGSSASWFFNTFSGNLNELSCGDGTNTTTLRMQNDAINIVANDNSVNRIVSVIPEGLKIFDEGNTNGVTITTPSLLSATWTLTLPSDNGTVDYVLRTDGSGITSWVDVNTLVAGAGGGDLYKFITDGTNTATAVANDTLKFRSSDSSITFTVGDNDVTHGDNVNAVVASVSWGLVTGTPTTLAGYGIVDAYTQTQLQTSGQSSVHWDNITNKPAQTWSIVGDSGTDTVVYGDTITFAGGTNVSTSYSTFGDTLVINATNNFVDGASFNTGDGLLTLTRDGLGDVTVNLDGRYALTSHTHLVADITDLAVFKTISKVADSGFTWGVNDVVASTGTDTLKLVAGTDIDIDTDDTGKALRIRFTGDIGGITSAYTSIDDGTNSASATGTDNIRFRTADNKLSILVGSNDVTHGDNVLFTVNEGNINHDNLAGYSANEHIDHSTVSIIAGVALTGGGNLTTSRTLDVDTTYSGFQKFKTISRVVDSGFTWGTGNIVADDIEDLLRIVPGSGIEIDTDSTQDAIRIRATGSGGLTSAYTSMTDGTTTSTSSGGDTFKFRTANNILAIAVTNDDVTHGDNALFTINEGNIDHDALLNYVANEHIDHSSVSITAGTGLTGGGDITTSRSLSINTAYSGFQKFKTIHIDSDSGYTWGSADVVADDIVDTLNIIGGTDITIESDSTLDALRITYTGGASANVYSSMTDGTGTSTASGGDTFKFRTTSSAISLTVTNDDATHGDNLLIDWSAGLNDLTDVDDSGKSNGDVLRWNGSNWTPLTPPWIDGSGTTNRLAKFTDSNTIGNSIIQDNGNEVGVNTGPVPDALMRLSDSTHTFGIQIVHTYAGDGVSDNGSIKIESAGANTITRNIGIITAASNSSIANIGISSAGGTSAPSLVTFAQNQDAIGGYFQVIPSDSTAGIFVNNRIDGLSTNYGVYIESDGGGTNYGLIVKSGLSGFNTETPTARVHIDSGTSTLAPLKLSSGVNLSSTEDGAMEYDGTHLYFTVGATRYQLDQQGGTGANTSLSNLVSTSINQSLVPDTADTYNIGSTSNHWLNVYTTNIERTSGNLTIKASGASALIQLSTGAGGEVQSLSNFYVDGQGYSKFTDKGNSGSSITINWNDGNVQKIKLTASVTISFSNLKVGAQYQLIVETDTTNSYSITWPGTIWWASGTTPTTPVAAAGSREIYSFVVEKATATEIIHGTVSEDHSQP